MDADPAVLDLNTVNWDALPGLWERADTELGVAKPTMRYIVVDTDIIDGTPSLQLYLSDDSTAARTSSRPSRATWSSCTRATADPGIPCGGWWFWSP